MLGVRREPGRPRKGISMVKMPWRLSQPLSLVSLGLEQATDGEMALA